MRGPLNGKSKIRLDSGNQKKRHSVEALDFSTDWVYDVPSFLRTLRLHKYIPVLAAQNVVLSALLEMNELQLEQAGISTQVVAVIIASLKYE